MAENIIFTITIQKFAEHNKISKKGFTHFMVAKRIFSDPKIANLSPSDFRLYLYFLAICADFSADCIRIDPKFMPNYFRIDVKSMSNSLERMQSLQLLSYASNGSLLNRIEKKRTPTAVGREIAAANDNNSQLEKVNSSQSFDDQFLLQEWISCLKKYGLDQPELRRKIRLIKNSFLEIAALENFIAVVAEADTAKEKSPQQARRYIAAAIAREAGLR
jgi:hypothetical protein